MVQFPNLLLLAHFDATKLQLTGESGVLIFVICPHSELTFCSVAALVIRNIAALSLVLSFFFDYF